MSAAHRHGGLLVMSRLDDAVFSCGRVLSQCVRGSPRSAAVKRKAIWCYGSLRAFSAAALADTALPEGAWDLADP